MVIVLQSYLFNIGQLIYEIEIVVKDVFQISSIYQTSNIFTSTYNYNQGSDLTNKITAQIQNCNTPSVNQLSSICTEALLDNTQNDYQKYLLGQFIDLDNYIPNLYQQKGFVDKIFRLFVQTYSNLPPPPATGRDLKRNIFKIYPSSNIDNQSGSEPNYYLVDSKFYQNQQTNMEVIQQSKLMQKIFIQGPYPVYDYLSSTKKQVISLSSTFKAQINAEEIYFSKILDQKNKFQLTLKDIRVELLMSTIDEFIKQQNYQSQNEIIIVNKNGTFVYLTDYWQVNQQSVFIFDQTMQDYSGLDEQNFQDLIQYRNQIEVQKLNRDGIMKHYLVSPVLLNNTFDANDIRQYLQHGVNDVQNDNYFVILLYGDKEQMYGVIDKINTLSASQKYMTKLICVITSFITIVLVYIATYCVSVKVDRPLRLILKILKKLNNSVTLHQNILIRIQDQLLFQSRNSQYQVRDLLISFIDLIEKLIQRFQDKTNNTISITIDYPLNDLEKSFLKKTKGSQSQFDWEKLDIQDQFSNEQHFDEMQNNGQDQDKQLEKKN